MTLMDQVVTWPPTIDYQEVTYESFENFVTAELTYTIEYFFRKVPLTSNGERHDEPFSTAFFIPYYSP